MMKIKSKGKSALLPGHFILRNNGCSGLSHSGKEIGVALSDEYYIDIDSLLNVPISHEEARQYGKRLNLSLPSKKMIRLLAENQTAVNNSLLSIGRRDCLILGDVDKDFWTSRSNLPKSDRRKVLFIRPVHQH